MPLSQIEMSALDTVIRELPRISKSLREIAKSLEIVAWGPMGPPDKKS